MKIPCSKCGRPLTGKLDHAQIAKGMGVKILCPDCMPTWVRQAMKGSPLPPSPNPREVRHG
jgi:hypothetical protein